MPEAKVIIPIYNENGKIKRVFETTQQFSSVKTPLKEIIIAEDKITGGTSEIAASIAVVNPNVRLLSPNEKIGTKTKLNGVINCYYPLYR